MNRRVFALHARDMVLPLGHETRIMGIVNVTPDSFSHDGLHAKSMADRLRFARKLVRQGADILDIGGESTRPGAFRISAKTEIGRVVPFLKRLKQHVKVPISIDTSKQEVAKHALDAGACIVNNVMGHQLTPSFLRMVRDYQAAIVIMHMRGTPATMQSKALYKHVIKEVIKELKISIEKSLSIGIKKHRIIIDPGIGFAKRCEDNLMLINHLEAFHSLGFPILLGPSRKSFLGDILQKDAAHRLMGTAACVATGILRGVHMVRVHDVGAIKETVKVTDAILLAHP